MRRRKPTRQKDVMNEYAIALRNLQIDQELEPYGSTLEVVRCPTSMIRGSSTCCMWPCDPYSNSVVREWGRSILAANNLGCGTPAIHGHSPLIPSFAAMASMTVSA